VAEYRRGEYGWSAPRPLSFPFPRPPPPLPFFRLVSEINTSSNARSLTLQRKVSASFRDTALFQVRLLFFGIGCFFFDSQLGE
jgi:hypothetical protein